MPKASPIQTSFNAGELSPQLKGRVDIPKYKNGCDTLENFLPQIHGPIKKRPGTRFVAEVKDSADNCRLFPFQYSIEQAYVLEFGDLYIRFYKDGGVILSGGSPYEISTPYAHTELAELQYAQSADVIYITHPEHPPYKLGRTGHTAWTLTEVTFDWFPFNDINTDDTLTVTASATTGTGITLTASSALFASTDVGSFFKFDEVIASKYTKWEAAKSISSGAFRYYDGNLYKATNSATTGTSPPIHTEGTESDGAVNWQYQHSGAGYCEIKTYSSSTSVTADVIKLLPTSSTSGTRRWSQGAWSDTFGWPRSVAFYEDRLWFAGNKNKPQTLWASTSGDYENHEYGTKDDDALNYTINSQEVNTILWMIPGKSLTVGTSGGEFIVAASSSDQAITPTNVRITPQTTFGGLPIQPFKIGNAILFVQRSGRKIREFTYNFETDAYVAPSMTLLAEHITQAGIKEMTYQQEPYQVIWVIDNNGLLLGLTYERTEDVVGWHRNPIAGTDTVVESATTIPHWDGDQDSTWLVVKRTVNGSTVRYIEYIEKYLEDEYSLFLDCALTYDGSPATVISGLGHLEGESVSILADGYVHPNRTVTSGSITLQKSASVVNIGLSYNATITTMPIEAGAADGTAQGKTMRITNVTMRLYNTAPGLYYGPDTSNMDEYHVRGSNDLMDNPVPLFTGDSEYLAWPDGYESGVQITLQHRTPLPCTLIALMPQVHTYDR